MAAKRKLNRREKYAVALAAGVVIVYIFFQFVFFPFMDQRDIQKRKLALQDKTMTEMLILKSEYDSIKNKSEASQKRFRGRPQKFSLFSFLETLAGQVKIKENISYMKPTTSTLKNSPYKLFLVEMKLTGINMEQLSAFLYRIETSRNMIMVKRLSITKSKREEKHISAVLQVETLEKA